ncbi:MAG: acyloxyacyl hydrolase [Rickettsiales bacterium]|nr:acyloxyacyl hydrolase [Rickettsiales bacterium]MCA0254125.1 acyloxyacyl hydrolase [Pseudomonadota bacterium]
MYKKVVKLITWSILFANTASAEEIKIGISQHDFDRKLGNRIEKGKNINIEFLANNVDSLLNGRPHIGISMNNQGYTSNFYSGVTWTFNKLNPFYVEASLGVSLNNGVKKTSNKQRPIGSNLLFRESISIGYNISDSYNVSLMVDHISSADIAKPNPGLTDIGIRIGYKF